MALKWAHTMLTLTLAKKNYKNDLKLALSVAGCSVYPRVYPTLPQELTLRVILGVYTRVYQATGPWRKVSVK